MHYEQLFGTVGFDGMSSLMYHLHRPTMVKEILGSKDLRPQIAVEKNMKSRRLIGFDIKAEDDFLDSRQAMLTNSDLTISLAAPKKSMTEYFYKNTDADEVILFIKEVVL